MSEQKFENFLIVVRNNPITFCIKYEVWNTKEYRIFWQMSIYQSFATDEKQAVRPPSVANFDGSEC